MRAVGDKKEGAIRPEFDRSAGVDFRGAMITGPVSFPSTREIDQRFNIHCLMALEGAVGRSTDTLPSHGNKRRITTDADSTEDSVGGNQDGEAPDCHFGQVYHRPLLCVADEACLLSAGLGPGKTHQADERCPTIRLIRSSQDAGGLTTLGPGQSTWCFNQVRNTPILRCRE